MLLPEAGIVSLPLQLWRRVVWRAVDGHCADCRRGPGLIEAADAIINDKSRLPRRESIPAGHPAVAAAAASGLARLRQ